MPTNPNRKKREDQRGREREKEGEKFFFFFLMRENREKNKLFFFFFGYNRLPKTLVYCNKIVKIFNYGTIDVACILLFVVLKIAI